MVSKELLDELQQKIGHKFKNDAFLLQSLTHRSFLNENPNYEYGHNERMEFLGDAVLEMVATQYLYHNYLDKNEGELTAYRAALVRGRNLARIAHNMDLGKYILMSKGERKDVHSNDYIFANAVEALLAALYLDGGIEPAQNFVTQWIIPGLEEIINNKLFIDSKSLFQEKVQEDKGLTPVYEMLGNWGPDHDKTFKVCVKVGDEIVAEGLGASKQKAEQDAAKKALDVKKYL
jgi:ribonuclease-3